MVYFFHRQIDAFTKLAIRHVPTWMRVNSVMQGFHFKRRVWVHLCSVHVKKFIASVLQASCISSNPIHVLSHSNFISLLILRLIRPVKVYINDKFKSHCGILQGTNGVYTWDLKGLIDLWVRVLFSFQLNVVHRIKKIKYNLAMLRKFWNVKPQYTHEKKCFWILF